MKKRTKRTIFVILFFIAILIGLYFIDKDTFLDIKDSIVKEVEKVIVKDKKSTNKKQNKSSITEINNIKLNDNLMVIFIDVGQAESILVKSQNDYMLIDAGNNADGKKLVKFLTDLGIKEFKYVFGTHAHEDHIGGMDNVIREFKIKNFYMPDVPSSTTTFTTILDELEKKNITFKTPKIGSKLNLGDSIIEVIYVGKEEEDLNDTSIILKLTYKDTSFLFTGDTTSNVEQKILDKDLKCDVLKVAHHGSKYSSSAAFLAKAKPKYAVIFSEVNNDYYFPHVVVLNKLEKIGAEIYRTDKLGTIIAISNGKKITFKNIKTDTNGV